MCDEEEEVEKMAKPPSPPKTITVVVVGRRVVMNCGSETHISDRFSATETIASAEQSD